MINFVNTCFFKPSLLLKSVCILTWELRSSRIILWWNHMKQFLKYNFFQIVRYFWNPFACLLAKYVTGGLFDKRNEGSFFYMGISTPWICLPASLSKTRYCASLHPTRNTTQWLPKWLLNSLSLHNRMTCELLPRKARKESGNSSPVSSSHRSKMAARRPLSFSWEMNLTPEQSHFLQNLRLHLIDLSRRLEQDVNEDVTDYVLFRL